jgi:phenylglyoxylate dehydrogenase epsilon subunit
MAAKKHLIIGAGSAALSALDEIRRVNSEDEVKLVNMEDDFPYSPAALPYLLSGKITEEELWAKDNNHFKNLRSTLVRGKEVTQILPEKKKVIYRDGSSESYDTLLIASGSEPIRHSIDCLGETEILDFKTLADCRRLFKKLKGRRNVAILGAGLAGMHIATALLEKGNRVSVIEKEQGILPPYFNGEAEVYIREIFTENKALIITGKMATAVKKEDSKISITFSDGSSMDVDILINATGVKGRVSFLQGTGIRINNGILVDSRMSTGIDQIYAAGDVAEAHDFFSGKPKINASIPSAVRQGRVAGANMVGIHAEYEGGIPMAALNFMGNQAFSIGLSMIQGEAGQVLKQKDDRKRRFKKLVFDGDRLVGGMFLNERIDPGMILYLIRERVDLAPYKEALFEGTKPLSDPWLSSLKFSSAIR